MSKASSKTASKRPRSAQGRTIITDMEARDLRDIWYQDIRAYWPSVDAIAEDRNALSKHVSEEVWRGTTVHAAFWGPGGAPARESDDG